MSSHPFSATTGAWFFPVGMIQLYIGPVAGIFALWPLAYRAWKRQLPPAAQPRPVAQ